ncbi:LOW QUALITY PROTEIN: hypothetical protein HID58_071993, partial [Brassica napus]
LCLAPSSMTSSNHAMDLFRFPCSSPPSTEDGTTTNVSASSFLFSTVNRRVCLDCPELASIGLRRPKCSNCSTLSSSRCTIDRLQKTVLLDLIISPHPVRPQSNEGDVTAARREDAYTTVRREDADTTAL